MHIKVDQHKTKVDLNSLAICKEIAKIDVDKLSQREVSDLSCDPVNSSQSQTNPISCSSRSRSLITKLFSKPSSIYTTVNVNYPTRQFQA